jgi:hypothetical protein
MEAKRQFYDFIYDQEQVALFWARIYDRQMRDLGLDNNDVFIYSYIITREKYMKDKGGNRGMFTEQNSCSVGETPNAYLAMINSYCRASNSFYRKDPPPNCELEMNDFVVYSDVNLIKGISIAQSLVNDLIDKAYHPSKYDKYRNICRFPYMQLSLAKNSRYWVDFDIDIVGHTVDMDSTIMCILNDHLNMANPIGISTAGGIHLLVPKNDIPEMISGIKDPIDIASHINRLLSGLTGHEIPKFDIAEVILNNAHSVPTPGTIQRGHKVCMI